MNSFVTQVGQEGTTTSNLLFANHNEQSPNDGYTESNDELKEDYEDGDSLIHMNIQGKHYYITRDQLMSLPESILLCLFPSGVFLNKESEVITNLTPEDEVYIADFTSECFEYIMSIYSSAYDDFSNFPLDKIFGPLKDSTLTSVAKGFFGFGNNTSHSERDILHQKPAIIVLREDLDYYCIPNMDFEFLIDKTNKTADELAEAKDDLLSQLMVQIKIAAGSYLTSRESIFEGLSSSNRTKNNHGPDSGHGIKQHEKKVGSAEQHLTEMLCSSGFKKQSKWGDRTQENGKTIITSLSLCRIYNESTEEFRNQYATAKNKWESGHLQNKSSQESLSKPRIPLPRSMSHNPSTKKNGASASTLNIVSGNNGSSAFKDQISKPAPLTTASSHPNASASDSDLTGITPTHSRKSRFSRLTDNVRSRSASRNRSSTRANGKHELPRLYDLVPKPNINTKLLLFWRKPARKCWWSEEEAELNIEVYGVCIERKDKKVLQLVGTATDKAGLIAIRIPTKLHIRRVWTLELSVIGA